ncbi:MAG: 2-succinyl-5-enolpyruvyl-6-hydroxy-3-cyclohexene-1-carboxylic-acid synthase [Myxococcaceae bacterium]
MTAPNLNYAWSHALLDELVKGGVRHAVVCPGSRSSPLAVSCAETDALRTWSVIDERSAGFFALGIARASGAPAALIATSGSAGAHFLPAAVEASMSGVPLVVLTADRPWELQGFGAPQTIPQHGLLGRFAVRFDDLALPEATEAAFSHLRAVASRAVSSATRARGVVHLNVPFREPLAPTLASMPSLTPQAVGGRGTAPYLSIAAPSVPSIEQLERVAECVRGARRGVIVCGPRGPGAGAGPGFGEAVHELAQRAGFAVIADATSQARFGFERAVAHADLVLQNPRVADALTPDVVLRFGGGLTSKRLQSWLDGSGATTILFSDDGALFDPMHRAAQVVEGDTVAVSRALASLLQPGAASTDCARAWFQADRRARAALEDAFAADPRLTEPRIAREVVGALGSGSNLFVSSSMPIREVDAWAPPSRSAVRVFCNRGANGIDGIVSTALGVSAGSRRPTVLLTGDVAFLHDLGGLLTAHRERIPLTLVVVNNDGGGIFSFLPIAGTTPHFEKLFGTPHGLELSHAARLFGATYTAPSTPAELASAVRAGQEGGLHLVEVRVAREINPEVHRALAACVVAALETESST